MAKYEVGGLWNLEDGTGAKIITGLDDHWKFCVWRGIMVRATARPVCGFFAAALARHGAPEEVLTDIQDDWWLAASRTVQLAG